MRCSAEDRQALEQLCRYITRPAQANERVHCNAAGQVVLKLKTPWRDRTTHQGRRRWSSCSGLRHGRSKSALRSLVPRPRLHLIRFHGVLAHRHEHQNRSRRAAAAARRFLLGAGVDRVRRRGTVGAWRMDRLEHLHINKYETPSLVPGLLGAAILMLGLVLAMRALARGVGLLSSTYSRMMVESNNLISPSTSAGTSARGLASTNSPAVVSFAMPAGTRA